MSQALTIRRQDAQAEQLGRFAQHLNATPAQASATLIEEGLRMAAFPRIVFRDSPVGRQAYVEESSLAVWEVLMVAREHGSDAGRTASYLQWPPAWVEAALRYAAAFPDEIEAALQDNASYDEARILAELPTARVFTVTAQAAE